MKKILSILIVLSIISLHTATAATYGRTFIATTTSATAPITPATAWLNAPIWASYFTATSTTATSTFAGNINVLGNLFKNNLPVISSQWVDGGAGKLYYMGGNVGIGTTSPSQLLTVDSGSNSTGLIQVNAGNGVNTMRMGYVVGVGGVFGTISANRFLLQTGALSRVMISETGGVSVGSTYVTTDAGSGNLIVQGNVGIGTTSPFAKLSVAGSAYIGGNLTATGTFALSGAFIDSTNSAGSNGNILQTDGNSTHWVSTTTLGFASATQIGAGTQGQVPFYNGAGSTLTATSSLFIAQSGKIGIGTVSPYGSLLNIVKNSTYNNENLAGLSIDTGVNGESKLIFGADATNNISYIQSMARLTSYTSKALVLQPNGGFVGIGKIAPSTTLDVAGTASSTGLQVNGNGTVTGALNVGSVTTTGNLTVGGTFDPNGLVTLPTTGISGAGTGSGLDADLLDGVQGATYFKNSDVVMNTNPFGGRQLYVNSINNAMFRADARWNVTGSYYNTSDDSLAGTYSQAQLATLFDGNYESKIVVPNGTYAIVNINFSTEAGGQFPGYPYGNFYVSNYSSYFISTTTTSTVRTYSNYAPHGIGWHTYNFSTFYNAGSSFILTGRNDVFAISQAEFKFYAPDFNQAQVTEIDWKLDRPGSNEMPLLDKFTENNLYSALTFKNSASTTIRINNSGSSYFLNNVGIGKTSPAYKLDVAGIGSFDDYARASYFSATSTTATSTFAGGMSVSGASGLTVLQNDNVGIGTTTPSTKLMVYDSANNYSGFFYGNSGLNGIAIGTRSGVASIQGFDSNFTGVQNISIQPQGGNVGIGTTSPQLKFHVSGPTALPATSGTTQTGIMRLSADGVTPSLTTVLDFGVYNSTGAGWIQATDKANLALSPNRLLLLNPNGGNVGIGTTTPLAKLTVFANTSGLLPTLRLENGGSFAGAEPTIDFVNSAGGITHARISSKPGTGFGASQLTFSVADSSKVIQQRAIIDVNGFMGLGTSTPNTMLNVYGGGIGVNPGATAQPTCSVATRGTFWNTFGGAGVADTFQVCQKSAADSYSWVTK